jgi:hypothetical protein
MAAAASSVSGNRLAHSDAGRRANLANSENSIVDEAKKLKERGLTLSFPAKNEIVGDFELELLMMNGYFCINISFRDFQFYRSNT